MIQDLLTWIRRKSALSIVDRELHPGLKLPVVFRPYTAADLDALLNIYDLNAPSHPAESRASFADYLQRHPTGMLVGELQGKPVCCGGVTQLGEGIFNFCYGMVHPEYQKQRVGTTFTLLLLSRTTKPKEKAALHVVIFAVPASLPFYQRFGFIEAGSWKSADGTAYPMAKLSYHSTIAQHIGSVLKWRKIEVEGEFQPLVSDKFKAKAVSGKKDQGSKIIVEAISAGKP